MIFSEVRERDTRYLWLACQFARSLGDVARERYWHRVDFHGDCPSVGFWAALRLHAHHVKTLIIGSIWAWTQRECDSLVVIRSMSRLEYFNWASEDPRNNPFMNPSQPFAWISVHVLNDLVKLQSRKPMCLRAISLCMESTFISKDALDVVSDLSSFLNVVKIRPQISQFKDLTHFELFAMDYWSDPVVAMPALCAMIRGCQNLRHLVLTDFPLVLQEIFAGASTAVLPQLETLDLVNSDMSDDTILELLRRYGPRLTTLSLPSLPYSEQPPVWHQESFPLVAKLTIGWDGVRTTLPFTSCFLTCLL